MACDYGGTGPSRNAVRKRRRRNLKSFKSPWYAGESSDWKCSNTRRLLVRMGLGRVFAGKLKGSTGQAFTHSQDAGQRLQLIFGPARMTSHTHHLGCLLRNAQSTLILHSIFERLIRRCDGHWSCCLLNKFPTPKWLLPRFLISILSCRVLSHATAPRTVLAFVKLLTRSVLPDSQLHPINAALCVLEYE